MGLLAMIHEAGVIKAGGLPAVIPKEGA